MKKHFLLLFFLVSCIKIFSQNYYFATPQGYGAATTGGGNSTPVTVSNYTDLKTNMTTAGAKVILVSGQITIPSGQPISAIISNKTIIGLPGAKLINETQSNPGAGIIYLKPGSNNVIIRNLIFIGPGAYDIDGQDNLTSDGCTNLWVDHCEFQDGQDGNYDNKGLTDNVTVSWCKFTYLKPAVAGGSGGSNDHRFSNLVGSSSTDAPADGHYSITFQNNYWASGCKDRMPRARNAQLHLLNCYFNVNISGSKAIGLGGGINNTTCYVQNSHFANVGTVYTNASSDGGTVAINYSNNISAASLTNIGTVSPPAYTFTTMPTEEVAARLSDPTCGAGATLQVNSSGVITPGVCTNLSTTESTIDTGVMVYPSPAQNILNIRNLKDETYMISISSAEGKLLLSDAKKTNSNKTLNINIESLKPGIYFYKIKSGSQNTSGKFIKE